MHTAVFSFHLHQSTRPFLSLFRPVYSNNHLNNISFQCVRSHYTDPSQLLLSFFYRTSRDCYIPRSTYHSHNPFLLLLVPYLVLPPPTKHTSEVMLLLSPHFTSISPRYIFFYFFFFFSLACIIPIDSCVKSFESVSPAFLYSISLSSIIHRSLNYCIFHSLIY